MNSAAVNGGPIGPTGPVPFGSTANRDPLSVGTAWLYSRFSTGQLPSATGSGHYVTSANQGLLQQAFWWLEGEANDPDYSGNATSGPLNPYVALAVAAVGKNGLDVRRSATPGQFGVWALNLASGSPAGPARQDQLYYDVTYVPDGGGTCALFGISVAALPGWSRKIRG